MDMILRRGLRRSKKGLAGGGIGTGLEEREAAVQMDSRL